MMSDANQDEFSDETHFFVRDSFDSTKVYAVLRKQHAGDPAQSSQPVVSVAPGNAPMSGYYYKKAFMKSSQPESLKQSAGRGRVRTKTKKQRAGRHGSITHEDVVDDNPQIEPGIPADEGDSEEEEIAKTKKRKIPCEPQTYYKLQALHEKNPFQYPDLSGERKEAWESAVRLGKGTSDSTVLVVDREVASLKATLARHLKKYKQINKLDFGTGEEREQQYEEYMTLMRHLEECKDNGVLAERNPKKAKKDAAVARRLKATQFAMRSGISRSELERVLSEEEETERYDDDFANADLTERCDEMTFDRDEMIRLNEDGIMESYSPFPDMARRSGSIDNAAVPPGSPPATSAADLNNAAEAQPIAESSGPSSAPQDKVAASKKSAGNPALKKNTPKKSPFKGFTGIRGATEAMRKTASLKRGRGQLANLTDSLQVAVARMNNGDAKERSAEQSESFWNRMTEKEREKADREERKQRETDDRAERDRVRALQVEREVQDRKERAEEMEEKKQERKDRYELMKLELDVRAKEAENKGNDSKLIMELLATIVKNQNSSNKSS